MAPASAGHGRVPRGADPFGPEFAVRQHAAGPHFTGPHVTGPHVTGQRIDRLPLFRAVQQHQPMPILIQRNVSRREIPNAIIGACSPRDVKKMDHLERMQIVSVSRLLNNLLNPTATQQKSGRAGACSALAVAKAVRANIIEMEKELPFLPSCNPGWRILLEIYIADGDQRPISVSDIGHTADIAGATTLRWLKLLETHKLVTRHPDLYDRRRCWLHLTAQARTSVMRIMNDMSVRLGPADVMAHLG